jgi:excisionase family DNA binding protein
VSKSVSSSPVERLFTITEVAELVKLNRHTVRTHAWRGVLKTVRVGPRTVRVTESALRDYTGGTP